MLLLFDTLAPLAKTIHTNPDLLVATKSHLVIITVCINTGSEMCRLVRVDNIIVYVPSLYDFKYTNYDTYL